MNRAKQIKGTTLIETLIAASIFVVFSLAIYQLYAKVVEVSTRIRLTTIATQVAGQQVELIRNLQYSDVGTVSGIPSGVIPQTQTVVRSNVTFLVTTTIRNIDHPADGTLGGIPNDLSPADNKLVSVVVSCTSCTLPISVTNTSFVAPKALETENGNGALVIKAINASGQPVVGATVRIQNSATVPTIDITDVTDSSGALTIVDAPPSIQNYSVLVSKNGFSTERTYAVGDVANPNPSKPHLTVSANNVTQSTFAIDTAGSITLRFISPQCASITNISGSLTGAKLIGTSPDIKKNTFSFSNAGASTLFSGVEWDIYEIALSTAGYDIAGTNPLFPLSLNPGNNQVVSVTLKPASTHRLVVAVVDNTGLPIADATVEIDGPGGTKTGQTSIGSVTQTDWAGGSGQADFTNATQFLSDDGGIEYGVTGQLRLFSTGPYVSSGELTSSSIDFGQATTFQQLSWLPISQPVSTGATSVRFQIATNTDNATWNFLGPDGTASTYYTSSGEAIAGVHSGDRYLRYKVFLSTSDTTATPTITDVAITYTSGCLPPGQIDFSGLSNGSYTITVSKTGYTTTAKTITLSGDTYETLTLTP